MSSRQVKWLREQMKIQKETKPAEEIEEGDYFELSSTVDFTVLADNVDAPQSVPTNNPIPGPIKERKKKNKAEVNENEEFEQLLAESNLRKGFPKKSKKILPSFSMQNLNLARELKQILGTTAYDDYLKLPKQSSNLRFIGKLKSYPIPFPDYYVFEKTGNGYFVEFTELGNSQNSILEALERSNDIPSILEMFQEMPLCPRILPIMCQSLLFQREFEKATSIVLRGFYILQQSLPQGFIPLEAKLYPSNARESFLELISFLARFSFRRCCFTTSQALWEFGLSLTDDDPLNFSLLSAIPALYSNNSQFIDSILESKREWRGIPIQFIPDWSICSALLKLPDDCLPIAKEIAKWPFIFHDIGVEYDLDVPPLLMSIGEAFRRRTKKFFESSQMLEMLNTSAMISTEYTENSFHSEMISHWMIVDTDNIELGDFVEEFFMPAG